MDNPKEETIRILLKIVPVVWVLIAIAIPVGIGVLAAALDSTEHNHEVKQAESGL
jgi:hypothetical protein